MKLARSRGVPLFSRADLLLSGGFCYAVTLEHWHGFERAARATGLR